MELLSIIRNKPMFEHFTEEELNQFNSLEFTTRSYKKEETIFKKGELYSSLYLLVRGTVSVNRIDLERQLYVLAPGDVFGEISFLTRTLRHSTVIAKDDALVIEIDDCFFDKISRSMERKIKNYFIDLLLSRLKNINETLIQMARYSVGYNLEL